MVLRPSLLVIAVCAPALTRCFAPPPRMASPAVARGTWRGVKVPAQRAAASAFAGTVAPAPATVHARGAAARATSAMSSTAPPESETFQFQAEVSRVMDIIINSLYSNKDIFLRELVSNASDACDKKRFLRVAGEASADAGAEDLCIRVKADKEAKTITIEDKGIGMSREDLKTNLGVIAQSGTKRFLEELKAHPDDTNLIGQFGVGFYSAFLVADRVQVETKAEGGEQLVWTSSADGGGAFTISKAEDDAEAIEGSGTRVVLHLKPDAEEYLDTYKLRTLLTTYSEFISFPVQLFAEKTEYEQVPDEEAGPPEEGEPPKMKTVPKTVTDWETINTQKPLWMRPPSEVTQEEYAAFYKSAFRAWDEPLRSAHFSLEGQVEFRCLLFIPRTLPFELSNDMFSQDATALKLYVKRVFISDKFTEEVLPRWLWFLRALVDSEDLPLNVSRELLQRSKVLSIIAKRLVRKALDLLLDIASKPAEYAPFFKEFGKYVTLGLLEDKDNRDDLVKLARFASSRTAVAKAKGEDAGTTESEAKADGEDAEEGADAGAEDEGDRTSLEAYVKRMPEGQKQVYYVVGATASALEGLPVIEQLTARGYEVLFALDNLDELALSSLGKYGDYDVVDAARENVQVGDEDEKLAEKAKADAERLSDVIAFIKDTVGDQVNKVEVSKRLTSSPATIVQTAWGTSPHLERMMRAQGNAAAGGMSAAATAILEINADHAAVRKLESMVTGDRDAPETREFAQLLYDVAAVTSGYEIKDAGAFAKRIANLMAMTAEESPAATATATAAAADKGEAAATVVEVVEE